MNEAVLNRVWENTRALRPVIRAGQAESDQLRRLPDNVAKAFVGCDVNRLILPEDLGGVGLDPLTHFDLIEEVASYDGSAGWNFAVAGAGVLVAGGMEPELSRKVFSGPEQGVAGSGSPQGKAVAVEGGYRVTGKFAWASGIHQASWAFGGCLVFDGDERRAGPTGGPVVTQVLVPKSEAKILDTWNVGGLRGTGSTEFLLEDVFVPHERALKLYMEPPKHADPLFALPPSFFGFSISAVSLGVARGAVEGLKDLAHRKNAPPRPGLAEQAFTQYVVAKAEAMTNAGRLGSRDAFASLWNEVCETGTATMDSRAKLRRAMIHATESAIEAVQLCYRVAGGTALFENEPFERALRDVNACAGHVTVQQGMMEDAGRVALGLKPLLPLF